MANPPINATSYCAFDGIQVVGAITLTAGSPNLVVSGASFAASDVGKVINIAGGAGGLIPFVTSIRSYISATQVVLAGNAPVSISGASAIVTYGTDDTGGLNAFFASVSANKTVGYLPAGISVFSGVLNPLVGSNWGVIGPGSQYCALLYVGAATNNDLIWVGDTSTNQVGKVRMGGFRIDSATVLTSGTAIHFHKPSFSDFFDIECGYFDFNAGSQHYLWNGLWFDQTQWCTLNGFKAAVRNDAFAINGGTSGINGEFHLDNAQIAYCGGTGVHIGGGFGGFYFGYVSIAACKTGVVIDEALTAVNNREIFVGPLAVIDSNTGDNVYVNQATGSGVIIWHAWSASAYGSVGKGISIATFANGVLLMSGGRLFNNKGDGLYVGDASTQVRISSGVRIDNNGGYGVNGVPTSNVISDTTPVGNVNGSYNPSIGL